MEDKRKDGVDGDGSLAATNYYTAPTIMLGEGGRVPRAPPPPEPKSEEEKHQMQKAERIGKDRAKGEDPALKKKK